MNHASLFQIQFYIAFQMNCTAFPIAARHDYRASRRGQTIHRLLNDILISFCIHTSDFHVTLSFFLSCLLPMPSPGSSAIWLLPAM